MGKIFQTSENEKDEALQSNWYAGNYEMTYNAFLKVIKALDYKIIFENAEYREMMIENKAVKANVSIFEYSKIETSIDLVVESKSIFKPNGGKDAIKQIYEEMKKHITFKGVGLHK